MPSAKDIEQVDVLLVGAGFASYTLLNRLRRLGYNVKIYEKGAASGGIWYWNCYPGARVDSDTPIYQLFDKELWSEWTFKDRYAGWQELRDYFQFVDKKWKISEHVTYNKHVDSAVFDEDRHQWLVETSDGSEIYANWFLPCIGFASRRYTPPFPGLGNFRGDIYHTAVWPQHGVNLKGKRIAEIGTGASGTQVIQEIGDKAKELTVYLRTPNMCLPMNQRKLDPEEEERKKKDGTYEAEIEKTRHTFAGFTYDFLKKKTMEDTPEDREKFYHKLLIEEGGFRFWLNTYDDMLFDKDANYEAYKFWRKSVLARLTDKKKAEILAPETPPHPWGTKRPSLEQRFYEVVDQPHVKIVDINKSPIQEVQEKGIVTKDEGLIEVDVIILATGFDSVTGSLAQLNIQGVKGGTIADHWKDGTKTSMGIAMPEFPNMFFLYGPQAPTAFSNGPSCTQFQAEWVEKVFKLIKEQGITRLESTQEEEDDWCRRMSEEWNKSLFPLAKSWYQGANIPGRKVEPLNWAGGMVAYVETLDKSISNDFQGWHVQKGTKA
ncbi:Baeyer-Villiger monooxygenase [Cyphellophora attinorum]|uniref:Baeyer-Villiger monooxygenase n=1 Tax=Cyphellophora attinorum TaxID=1664694 RepID=A0A0N1P2W9_9EURO|nr:Baeyer-Villiger monooxygenase [Phialophora attinorum]KPI44383.1 Baeyer-Villiger monooxygenase [Phialophora attinorum]